MTTVTLPTGVVIPEDEAYVAKAYSFRCVAHPMRWMTCFHHEPPRSLNPRYKDMPETWYPVCDQCHNLVHRIGRKDAAYYLEQARTRNFPNAVKEIEKHVTPS